jgi:hypothetical protein
MGRFLAHLLCRGFEFAVACAAIFLAAAAGDAVHR